MALETYDLILIFACEHLHIPFVVWGSLIGNHPKGIGF